MGGDELIRVFCLGDVPVDVDRMDGSVLSGRIFGLRTTECVGFRGDAEVAADWIVSLMSDGVRLDLSMAEIAAITPRADKANEGGIYEVR